ncbi:hypothetical protein KAI32_03600 [Candidatus Pacearchaeota archaeon]|nr:hypothetical protein [Candidatus Pacearchaeota archaeon]
MGNIKDSLKIPLEKRCEHIYVDGAGHYCKAIPIPEPKDYPHKYYRVHCYGHKDSIGCKMK